MIGLIVHQYAGIYVQESNPWIATAAVLARRMGDGVHVGDKNRTVL